MREFGSNSREEQGAAAVEVAILSLVMVPMAIYAIFFFDLALVNIKTSEVARYAVWELTAMGLSNFADSSANPDHVATFNNKVEIVEDEVEGIWGDDMNSGTRPDVSYYGLPYEKENSYRKVTSLMVTEFENSSGEEGSGSVITSFSMGNSSPYNGESLDTGESPSADGAEDLGLMQGIISSIQRLVNGAATFMFERVKFNTQGFVNSDVQVKLKFDRKVPIYGDDPMIIGEMPTFKSTQKLLVDAWDLKDGSDVDWGQSGAASNGGNKGYFYQVDRMTFLGLKADIAGWLGDIGSGLSDFMDFLGVRMPHMTQVRSYALKNGANAAGTGCSTADRNVKGCVPLSISRPPQLSHSPRSGYYTNVVSDVPNFTDSSTSDYFQVYRKQSPKGNSPGGGYYMGCGQPEKVNRRECWQN